MLLNDVPSSLTLDDCLTQHFAEEEIDEWYCSHCKDHTLGLKKLELWKCPDILILHLKRFVYHPRLDTWIKLNTPVDFLLDEVDITKYSLKIEEKEFVYDLFGVWYIG